MSPNSSLIESTAALGSVSCRPVSRIVLLPLTATASGRYPSPDHVSRTVLTIQLPSRQLASNEIQRVLVPRSAIASGVSPQTGHGTASNRAVTWAPYAGSICLANAAKPSKWFFMPAIATKPLEAAWAAGPTSSCSR